MYKGASESLQRRHAVDKPHPSRGYIDGPPDARDVLPEIEALSLAQAEEEKRRLQHRVGKLEQDLAIAKRVRHKDIRSICDQKTIVQDRLKLVKERIKEINRATNGDTFRAAVKDVVDAATFERIIERHREIQCRPASGIEARSGETTEIGSTKGESATAESGDAQ